MRRRLRLTILAGVLGVFSFLPATLPAQSAAVDRCAPETDPATRRVCTAAIDALTNMLPTAGLVATFGNPRLGTAAGGHGFGDVALTIRAIYASTVLPASTYDGVGDTVPVARRLPAVVPSIDLSLGLLRKALPVGAVSLDFLGSMITLPEGATDYLRFPEGTRSLGGVVLGFGYGARIGFEPQGDLPTASLNVVRRDLPAFTFGDLSAGSTYAYTLSVSTIAARLMVGKRFNAVDLSAGAGVNLYSGNYSLTYVDPATRIASPRIDSTLSAMRIVTTVNAGFHLGGLLLGLEGGFQVGKDDKLTTIFEANDTRAGKFFAGLGLGIEFGGKKKKPAPAAPAAPAK